MKNFIANQDCFILEPRKKGETFSADENNGEVAAGLHFKQIEKVKDEEKPSKKVSK